MKALSKELRRVANLLETQENLLAKIERIASIGHWEWDLESNVVLWSEETYKIFGLERGNFAGTHNSFLKHVHPDDREKVEHAIIEAIDEDIPFYIEHRIVRPDGTIVYVQESAEVTSISGIPIKMIGIVNDITIQKKHEQELRNLAFRDSGTNLYNKRFFLEQLDVSLSKSLRGQIDFCLIMIDLDNFSAVNNTYGHIVGDELIKEIANRIVSVFPRHSDITARYGGDEFVILCYNIDHKIVDKKCNMLLDEIAKDFKYNTITIHPSASVGLCYFNGEGAITKEELLDKADSAMYKAKRAGKNQLRVYK